MIKNKLSTLGPTLTVAFAVKNGTAKLFAWPSKSAKTKADVRMRPTLFFRFTRAWVSSNCLTNYQIPKKPGLSPDLHLGPCHPEVH